MPSIILLHLLLATVSPGWATGSLDVLWCQVVKYKVTSRWKKFFGHA